MSTVIQQFETEKIITYFKTPGNVAITGLAPDLTIKRQSDGLFFDGSSFLTALNKVTMTETDSANCPGFYEYSFDTTGLNDAVYTMTASGTGASNHTQTNELRVGGFIDNLDKPIGLIGDPSPSVINLRGVFTKAEKDRLIELIAANFRQVIDLMNQVRTEQAFSMHSLQENIEDANKYMEAQTRYMKQSDELGEFAGVISE